METTALQLFKDHQDKTRILISSESGMARLVLHILDFCGISTDYILDNGEKNIQNNDFLIFESRHSDVALFHPNVVLLSSASELSIPDLLNSITGGGVLVYPENNENINAALENVENYFRRLPYTSTHPIGDTIETPMGAIPISFAKHPIAEHLEGVRLLVQQLSVMEEDFYEAVMTF